MASSLTVTNDFDKLGNNMRGEEVVPVSVASRWYNAISAGGPGVLDAATITNPDTQITDATRTIRQTGGRCSRVTFRLKRPTGLTVTAEVVMVCFGRTSSDDPWQRLFTLGGASTSTLSTGANDVTDGTSVYTDATLEDHTFDLMGCTQFLPGVQQAITVSVGSTALTTIQAKLT